MRILPSDWPHFASLAILILLLYVASLQSPLVNKIMGQSLIFWSILLEFIVAIGAYLNARPLVTISDMEKRAIELLEASPDSKMPYQEFADELDVIAGKLTSEDLVNLLTEKKLIRTDIDEGKRWIMLSRLRAKMI